jgi:hypothetical protein
MGIQLKNNASGTLATAINASDTGIVLTTGNGANFPSLGASDYFYATFESTGGTLEIIKVTARSGDSMTVVRAQEGTTAQSFAAGSRIELRVTAQSVLDVVDQVAAAQVELTPYGWIAATDVQAAFGEVVDDLAASSGSSLVGFIQSGTGASARTSQSKMREIASVLDFGADPTGVTNSATAFTNAIATGKLVLVPKGTYLRGATTTTYATDQYLGILRVGNLTTTNSSDPQVIVARDVDNSASGSGHCFSDSSNVNRLGGISYNSFDGRITLTGSYNYGHYAAFQAGPVFSGSGVIDDYFPFVCGLSISSGTLTNYYGLILQAPVITGTGAVTNCYGVFIPRTYGPPFSGVTTLNFAWYNDSASKSYNYGQVQADGGVVAGKNNAGAGTNYVNVKNIDAISANGTEAGIRLQQVGFNTWDWIIPASQIYCSIVANNVERFRMLNAGSFLPAADGTQPLGGASNRWSEVFAASGTINTSDEREKQDVAALDAAELRVAVALKGLVKKYRFKGAVKSKRDAARIHIGVIAQEVVAAFAAEGLDANSYALLCYDEWEAEVNADGTEVKPAGSRYGIRYEELLAFIIAAL